MTGLPDPRPTADKDAALVQAMFDRVAPRYDLANTIFSLGQDRHWRRVARVAAAPLPGEIVLDVASGTGGLAHELASSGALVVALDFSWQMLATGARRARRDRAAPPVLWCTGDGLRLPLADASVSAATIAFGLRNLPDTVAGLRELARVVRPGGRLVVLEFSRPTWRPFRQLYLRYLVGALPAAAKLLTSDPAAYRYLAASIQAWPDAERLAGLFGEAGWRGVRWKRLTGGIVAVHHATR
ncbi:MAG: class I SAM-dependent methyltransferase [Actinomycetota bacterium]|nr:class I SAM-dependent methyltransferase [Actinomycetota bacterium]